MSEEVKEHFSGQSNKEAWNKRRRMTYVITAFTFAYIILVTLVGFIGDVEDVHTVIIKALLTLTGAVNLYWFFGSTVQDISGKR